jgi:multiple sugar transport system ATP-binding protein
MAEVSLEHVTKHYATGVAALDGLSLTIADGELLVLVGPSGCGKTTTLRLIAGLETLTTGIIRIGGRVVSDLPPRLRDVALVFQRPTLYPHLSVADNLAFGVKLREGNALGRWLDLLRGSPEPPAVGADLTRRVNETAELLGLTDLLTRRPSQLSGGQQQRVALGRALVRHPAVFLLDEPLSNLDPTLRHEMRRELHLLQRRLRATMVYVTHDQVEAMTLGDRVVVLDRGRVQQVGPPLDLYERPANRFVAGFIGWPPMNLFDGRVVRSDAGMVLVVGGVPLPLPPETCGARSAYNEGDVTVGIRPESVTIGAAGWVMNVLLVEPLGSTTLVTLGRDDWQLLALAPGRSALRERDFVEVGLDVRHLHLFDRSTGMALPPAVASG